MEGLIGRRVEGFWGCLHPSSFGVIYGREGDEVLIRWESGGSRRCAVAQLKEGHVGMVGIYLKGDA